MRSMLRRTLLLGLVLLACGGTPGCSGEPENPTDKMEPAKTTGAMGGADTGKMGGAMDKMEKGKTP